MLPHITFAPAEQQPDHKKSAPSQKRGKEPARVSSRPGLAADRRSESYTVSLPKPADPAVDEKPFRLAKSFSLIAVVMIFAAVLTLAAVVSRQAEIIITKRVEDDTLKLMENLNHQMFEGFLVVASNQFGQIRLREKAQQELLLRVINNTIYGFDIKRVLIYNTKGQVVFATDDTLPESLADDMEAYKQAIEVYVPSAISPWRPPGDRNSLPFLEFYRHYLSPFESQWPAQNSYTLPGSRDQLYSFLPGSGPGADDSGPLFIPDNLETAYYALLWERAMRDLRRAGEESAPNGDEVIEAEEPERQPPALPHQEDRAENAFLASIRTQTVFRYEGGSFLLFNFFPQGSVVLRTYKAMENYGNQGLSGVLEISRDLTPEYQQIARLQYFALSVAFFLALGLTIVLFWVVNRGEAIITKRNLERQALREQLDQAERLAGLGSMVATVAHEIRNPLGIIHSTADVLNRFLAKEEPDRARLAKAIVEEANRLSDVVTEFLDFARPPEPRLKPVVVEEILEEILAFLEVTLVRAGVEVRCDLRKDQSPIPGDASMLHRAFLNILVNSIQAMDDGGLISVATSLEEKQPGQGRLLITISDTGPGLNEEAAKKMFSPFYTTKAKGTGLGLVIVRNIIEGHGGEITLKNGPPPTPGDDSGPGLVASIRLKAQ